MSSTEDRAGWNRFDLPGEQTIYCASSAEGAYGELLGALKVGGPYRAQEYLDDPGAEDLYALIARDFNDLGVRPPGVVDIHWLYAHRLYTVALPASGWLVEIEHARTITYLASHIPLSLWERGIDEITVAQTRSGDRHLTTELAATLAAAPSPAAYRRWASTTTPNTARTGPAGRCGCARASPTLWTQVRANRSRRRPTMPHWQPCWTSTTSPPDSLSFHSPRALWPAPSGPI
ncbi:hypothetical protein ACFSSF_19335 [Dietzia aerolata]|uniref:hypothetical protein n=1 Tax=Dietzia aerolata TaxID=595984 RepID=UPI00363C8321